VVEIVAADVQFLGRRKDAPPLATAAPAPTSTSADDVSPDEIPF